VEKIRYQSPKEAIEQDEFPEHSFDLIVDGRKIGAADLDYFSRPIPMYRLSSLYVGEPREGDIYRGQGYGSTVMARVEAWLLKKKKPGILHDRIDQSSPAKGMYARRGWVPVPDMEDVYVYNWPKDVDLSVLKGADHRYVPRELRRRK
jgi:GNAT superfamily N-acetyltransferase